MKIALVLATSILLLFTEVSFAHEPQEFQDHIRVTGTGEINQVPDQAKLKISISAQESSLSKAKEIADQRYSQVIKKIRSLGIEEKNIRATQIIAQPQYQWQNNKQVYKGEKVSRSLQVTVNNLEKVSELMQAIIEGGASSIDGITTGFKNPKAIEQEALKMAAEDAKTKADFLAKNLGRKLGKAYMISEQNISIPFHQESIRVTNSNSLATRESTPPELFGTKSVKASISVHFSLR